MGSFMIQIANVPALEAHFFRFDFVVLTQSHRLWRSAPLPRPRSRTFLTGISAASLSLKVALSMFILPFLFVYNPELLAFPKLSWQLAAVFVFVALVQWTISSAQFGYMFRRVGVTERVVLLLVGVASFASLLLPDSSTRRAARRRRRRGLALPLLERSRGPIALYARTLNERHCASSTAPALLRRQLL